VLFLKNRYVCVTIDIPFWHVLFIFLVNVRISTGRVVVIQEVRSI